jgi:hypothetical protein
MKFKIIFRKIQDYLKANKMSLWLTKVRRKILIKSMTKRTLWKITSKNVTVTWPLKMMKSDKLLLTWENLIIARFKIAQIKWTWNIRIIIVWATKTEWQTVFKDEEMIAAKILSKIKNKILELILNKIITLNIWTHIQMWFIITHIKIVFVSIFTF